MYLFVLLWKWDTDGRRWWKTNSVGGGLSRTFTMWKAYSKYRWWNVTFANVCNSGAEAPHLLRYLWGALVLTSFGAAPRSLGDRLSTGLLKERWREEGAVTWVSRTGNKALKHPPLVIALWVKTKRGTKVVCVCVGAHTINGMNEEKLTIHSARFTFHTQFLTLWGNISIILITWTLHRERCIHPMLHPCTQLCTESSC